MPYQNGLWYQHGALYLEGLSVKMCDERSPIPSQVVVFELLGFT